MTTSNNLNKPKKTVGRPRGVKVHGVGIGLETETLEAINAYCDLIKRNRSEVINELLTELRIKGRFNILGNGE